MAQKSRTGQLTSDRIGARFEALIARHTRLEATAARALFPTEADQEELVELLAIVDGATDENVARARLVENIGNVAGAVVKIGKRFATGR